MQWYLSRKLDKELVKVGYPAGRQSTNEGTGIYQFEGISDLSDGEVSEFKEMVRESLDEIVRRVRQYEPSYKNIHLLKCDYIDGYFGLGEYNPVYGSKAFNIVVRYGTDEMTDYTSF